MSILYTKNLISSDSNGDMMLYNRNLYNFIWARYTCQLTVCWKISYIWAPNKPFRYIEVQKEATNIT